jgi:hypothetical protein
MAESLRDRFGRGINMELALKVLLLGLVSQTGQSLPSGQRFTT